MPSAVRGRWLKGSADARSALALTGLLAKDERLEAHFTWMIEDARVFGPYLPAGG